MTWHLAALLRKLRKAATMTTTTIPGRLTVGKDGKLTGPADLHYNDPFPCVNGTPHVTGTMNGVIMHTMVGNLPGTIAVFNKPGFGASAHFGIAQDGRIHQFGPIGKGWEAWHAFAANLAWYGIEHADNGDPDNPLTPAQIAASAQLAECLSAFAGFKLQVCDDPAGQGYAYHSLADAWNLNHHTCPDMPPKHVRSGQRAAIVDLAQKIRAAATPGPVRHVIPAGNTLTWHQLAQSRGTTDAALAEVTRANLNPVNLAVFDAFMALNDALHAAGLPLAAMPAGMIWWSLKP